MTLPFDTAQLLTLLSLLASGVFAWAEIKLTIKSGLGRLSAAEAKIATLEAGRTDVALLGQEVKQMVSDIRGVEHELRNIRTSLGGVEVVVARVDERMKKEHHT